MVYIRGPEHQSSVEGQTVPSLGLEMTQAPGHCWKISCCTLTAPGKYRSSLVAMGSMNLR